MQSRLDEICQRFSQFMDGIRVIMLIDRGVMNSNKGSKRWINKIITTDKESWREAVEKLLELQNHLANPDIRMYACVNARNLDKAITMFRHRELDVLPDQKLRFYAKINNTFCSCLMKPENKAEKYFMLDIDSKDTTEADVMVSDHLIEVIKTYPTKNGWHYIVKPFDARLANGKQTFVLLKDGILLLNWLE